MYVIPHNCSAQAFLTILRDEYLPISRFRVMPGDAIGRNEPGMRIDRWPRVSKIYDALKIKGIRLKRRKPNCGQHAGPCLLTGVRRHKVTATLEGADWVAWNDMLNDLCDAHRIEAYIYTDGLEQSGRLYIRRGRDRRDRYCSWNGTQLWDASHDPNDFTDIHFGKREPDIRSDFVEGTPGFPEWLRVKEDLHPEIFEEHAHGEEHEEEAEEVAAT